MKGHYSVRFELQLVLLKHYSILLEFFPNRPYPPCSLSTTPTHTPMYGGRPGTKAPTLRPIPLSASHLFSVGTGDEGVLQRAALEVEQGKDAMVEVSS